jgi:hypothetical protein
MWVRKHISCGYEPKNTPLLRQNVAVEHEVQEHKAEHISIIELVVARMWERQALSRWLNQTR